MAGGAYAYVLKPFDPEDLLHQVRRAVRQVRSTREAEALRVALAAREERLSTLVDTVQALLLVLDEEGRVIQANHAVARAVGVDPEDLVGVDWMARFVAEPDRAAAQAAFARLRAGGPGTSQETRIFGQGPDGRPVERWVSWRSSVITDAEGAMRVYASGLETTEVRELERRARLSEKLAAVGTLSAGLAHEIRNPLNAATLQLRLLERRVTGRDQAEALFEPIGLVREELGRLSNLVVEFLAFARPSELLPETVDVVSLVRKVVDLERPGAEERSIVLSAEVPVAKVEVLGDADKLQQVLLNLVRNATEAVDAGGRVTVRVDTGCEGVVLAVADDGPGIPAEHQSRIFEPFYSTKPGGTGLGMAIVHSLVSLHGGEVSIRSGSGTEVRVVLPRLGPVTADPAPAA